MAGEVGRLVEGQWLRGLEALTLDPSAFPTPPQVRFPSMGDRFADRGPIGWGRGRDTGRAVVVASLPTPLSMGWRKGRRRVHSSEALTLDPSPILWERVARALTLGPGPIGWGRGGAFRIGD